MRKRDMIIARAWTIEGEEFPIHLRDMYKEVVDENIFRTIEISNKFSNVSEKTSLRELHVYIDDLEMFTCTKERYLERVWFPPENTIGKIGSVNVPKMKEISLPRSVDEIFTNPHVELIGLEDVIETGCIVKIERPIIDHL